MRRGAAVASLAIQADAKHRRRLATIGQIQPFDNDCSKVKLIPAEVSLKRLMCDAWSLTLVLATGVATASVIFLVFLAERFQGRMQTASGEGRF